MSRPPVIAAEKKLRIVLSVLQGEISIAEAARREKVSEQAIGNWKALRGPRGDPYRRGHVDFEVLPAP
ncbi:MAG: helix-turn-helix domain-containing protein [Microbacterium sp.]